VTIKNLKSGKGREKEEESGQGKKEDKGKGGFGAKWVGGRGRVVHLIVFPERPCIQQHGKPFSGSKLTLCVLSSHTLLASSSLCLRLDFLKALLKTRRSKSARGGKALDKR
jgi:hypothetical protein